MMKRLKGFYSTRRNVSLTRADSDKKMKRKHSMKASRRTFVRYNIISGLK